jgi:hypothetical protein
MQGREFEVEMAVRGLDRIVKPEAASSLVKEEKEGNDFDELCLCQ